MTYDLYAPPARSRGRSARRSIAWLLLPTALLVNACSDSDSGLEETDAGDSGRRDATADAVRADSAADSNADALRTDAGDAARDAQADVARTDAGADARVDASPADASTDAAPDARLPDAGVEAARDSGGDVAPDTAAPVDSGTRDTAAPEAAGPEAAAPEAAGPEAAAPEAATPVDAGAPEAAAPEAGAPMDGSTGDAEGGMSSAADAGPDAASALRFGFENGVSGWTAGPYWSGAPADPTIAPLTTSTVRSDTGTSSLAVTFTRQFTSGTFMWIDAPPGLVPGKVVTVRMYIPANTVAWLDIFDTDASPSSGYSDSYFHSDEPSPFTLSYDGWYTYRHVIQTVLDNDGGARIAPIQRLGFKFGVYTPGTIYIDSITW